MKSQYTAEGKKVFVGLSGGVDSAVSAALLKQEGYDVTGVFIKAWTPEWMDCTWKEDRRSAMRVAAVLDIPFVTLDLEKEYKEGVVDYMIREYKLGRTPNPDVMCNKEIKFGAFLKWALEKGADFVATGHYAQIKDGMLSESKDKNKDQTYFLWTLTRDQLAHTLFPVGGLEKPEVRKLAEEFALPQATRKDSQGLCFLGHVDMKEFLSHYIETGRGDVLNEEGKTVGYHDGAIFFTLGERHGFTITEKTDKDTPLYVIGKDIHKNTITVSPRKFLEEDQVSPRNFLGVKIEQVNFLGEEFNGKLECRFRYRQEKLNCMISEKDGEYFVTFENTEEVPASGQSVVFYDGEACLGGAVIQ